MVENHKIAVGLIVGTVITGGAFLFAHYGFHVPGTTLTISELKKRVMQQKLNEDKAYAAAAVMSRQKFNDSAQWWKDYMYGRIGVVPGVDAINLTTEQWNKLVSNVGTYTENLDSTYAFTDLIHKYPDALALWLSEIGSVNDYKKAYDFTLKYL